MCAVPFFNLVFLMNFYGARFNPQDILADAQAPGGNGYPHNIFAFAIAVLISAVNLKYQNRPESLFETHPKTAVSGVIVLLLYVLAFDVQQRLRNRINHPVAFAEFKLINRFIMFFGYMAVAILVTLIFPGQANPAVYAVYIAISVGDVVVLVCWKMRGWLRRRIFDAEQGIPA